MALKKVNTNQYIKLNLDGTFKIYETPTDRNLEKEGFSFKKISLKYQAIIDSLRKNNERRYYDPTFRPLLAAWELEYDRYVRAHWQGLKEKNFPLMGQYFKNIEDSLPTLVCEGQIGIQGNSLEEVYKQAKQFNYFGDVEDC